MDYVSGEPRPQEGEIAEAAFLPIRRLLDDPLAATYLKIILPRFTAREQGLAGRECTESSPSFSTPAIKSSRIREK